MQRTALTLYELNSLIRETLEIEMPDEYWVEAELSEAREVNGHCYMELIQTSDNQRSTVMAKASAKCWRNTWMLLRPHFERVTGQQLHAGMKVLLKVYAQFHEQYGFSWIVSDIDPTYTMGDMARKRQEIIRQLKEEGVFDLQKELKIPMFAQRIAVISSANAAGYGDFCNQLENNEYGFQFTTRLFPAVMQGEQVEASVIAALNAVYEAQTSNLNPQTFDVVVIIRGGGATSDLSGFDTLFLAENVANFPLPIITGIGHERDESVLDMVSCVRVKTPTAAAAFLISYLAVVYERIEQAQNTIVNHVRRRMEYERVRLGMVTGKLPSLFSLVKTREEARLHRMLMALSSTILNRLTQERHRLDVIANGLLPVVGRKLNDERHRLALLEEKVKVLDPMLLLKRGYSITLHNGKVVKDPKGLKTGDRIETRMEKGVFTSIVQQE